MKYEFTVGARNHLTHATTSIFRIAAINVKQCSLGRHYGDEIPDRVGDVTEFLLFLAQAKLNAPSIFNVNAAAIPTEYLTVAALKWY
jgi:hypothetical protein